MLCIVVTLISIEVECASNLNLFWSCFHFLLVDVQFKVAQRQLVRIKRRRIKYVRNKNWGLVHLNFALEVQNNMVLSDDLSFFCFRAENGADRFLQLPVPLIHSILIVI